MKFPINEQWKIDSSTDKGVGILATRNISFWNKKFATLAAKNLRVLDEVDDADLEVPIAFYNDPTSGTVDKMFCTDDAPYDIDLDSHVSISDDTDGAQPDGSFDSSGVNFDGNWVVTESADIHTNDGSTWTDQTVTLDTGVRHPLAVFKNRNNLAVGNGNVVKQFNTSYAETVNLTLPGDIEVTSLAYNRNLLAIVGASSEGDAYLFIWDGATSQANFGYPINASRGIFVVAYKDTFVCLTGAGEGLWWTGSGLERLFAFPSYFKTYQFAERRASNRTIAHDTSVMVDKQRIFMNVHTYNDAANEEPDRYDPLTPSGVWVFEPGIGLYHQNANTGAKLIEASCSQTGVDVGTDTITVNTSVVPETGTPVLNVKDSTLITGMTPGVVYYTIKVSDTEFQIATTYSNAIAGTEVDLTAVATGGYDFTFLPASDFGQLRADSIGGAIAPTGRRNEIGSELSIYTELVWGSEDINQFTQSDGDNCVCVACPYGENRGTLITHKLYSPDVTSSWQKLLVKARQITSDLDKVVLKARVKEDINMPLFSQNDAANHATWVDSTSFTTDEDLAYVKTLVDAGKYYEIEFIDGAASGYTAHITAITLAGTTYTVTIDETIKNISTGNVSRFVIDNWEKVKTAEDADSPDTTDDTNFIEYVFGDQFTDSKWIQFKFELRGSKVALEEYELIFDAHNVST